MKIKAWIRTGHGSFEENVSIEKIPDECSMCHHGIEPIQVYSCSDPPYLQIIFLCPREKCKSLFVAYYEQAYDGRRYSDTYYFRSVSPSLVKKKKFSEIIQKISKEFCNLYNQAQEADVRGLKDICGAGYRKALEFLIKDYLIHIKNKPQKEIEKKKLYSCIVDNFKGNLKTCAKRAVWLGNDETHYYRVWEDKDLEDLKDLIDVTLFWMESEYKTEKYSLDMPERDKARKKKESVQTKNQLPNTSAKKTTEDQEH